MVSALSTAHYQSERTASDDIFPERWRSHGIATDPLNVTFEVEDVIDRYIMIQEPRFHVEYVHRAAHVPYTSLNLQPVCVVVEEVRASLSVIVGDDLGPGLSELVALLRIQIILGPVRDFEVVVVGVLVVDERHDGGHDVERVVADGVRNCLEEVKESVESVERPEDRRRSQAGAAKQLADNGVVQD